MNNVTKEVRSFQVVATLYRALASLAALAVIAGVKQGGTPLDGWATACDAIGVPSRWTVMTASWLSERAEPVGGLVLCLFTVGLLALPRRNQLGWDLGQTMEWRGPSMTMVLFFALLVQCNYTWLALLHGGLLAALGMWMVRRGDYRTDRSEQVTVVVGAIFLAVIFAPLYVFAWLFGRDAGGRD